MAGPKAEQKGATHEGEDVSLEAHRERHREEDVDAGKRRGGRRRTDTAEAEKGEGASGIIVISR